MKKNLLLLLFLFILFNTVGIGQIKNSNNLSKQIEIVKEGFRKRGLGKIDQIEGIYKFEVELISEGYSGNLSSFNKRTSKTVYVAIISRKDNISEFEIWEYSEIDEEFLLKTTNWTINKWYRNSIDFYYQVNCKECDKATNGVNLGLNYVKSNVYINGDDFSFQKVSKNESLGITNIESYKTVEKIFPSTTESNIFKNGTGFVISQNGYIITNYHVIENSSNVFVTNKQFKRLKANIIYIDKLNDVAILKINFKFNSIPYNIVNTGKEVGSSVFTLGYPFIQTMGSELKITNGIINSNSGYENDNRYYQFSAEIQPGNSGGPLFDSEGNIIGLVSSKHTEATNAGYALKSRFVIDFIKINNPDLIKRNINSIKSLSLSAKYKALQNFVLLLEVE
jgi:S1-C subfamily serine protease